MNTPIKTAVLFLLALGLGACGGVNFSAADEDDGLAGAAGVVDPGTGGSAGSGAGGSSGQAGAGSGGAAAGSAGSGSSGSAGAGATGAGGEPSGGSGGDAGSGGAPEPTCTPEEAITTAALPESFNWDGFGGFWEGEDQDYCAYSDGGLCTLRNSQFTFYGDGSVTHHAYLSCSASFAAGPCGAEVACAASVDPDRQASLTLSVEPAGNGYRLQHISGPGALLSNANACNVEMPSGSSAPTSDAAQPDLAGDLIVLVARTYPCP